MKSQKEIILDQKLKEQVKELVEEACPGDFLPILIIDELLADPELKAIQDYANNVSINRIGLNDHGPVHMRIVCKNALRILKLLHQADVKTSLEKEGCGTIADSMSAVILASMLHDAGMTISRTDHELYSGIITFGIITRILEKVLPGEENTFRRTAIRSLAFEGIIGHMGTHPIHSMEAGLILVSDGCDMTKGRARIILENHKSPSEGDIHKYSAFSIEKVSIRKGEEKPVRIHVQMEESVGLFQIEGVLLPKMHASTISQHIELYASVLGQTPKRYL